MDPRRGDPGVPEQHAQAGGGVGAAGEPDRHQHQTPRRKLPLLLSSLIPSKTTRFQRVEECLMY